MDPTGVPPPPSDSPWPLAVLLVAFAAGVGLVVLAPTLIDGPGGEGGASEGRGPVGPLGASASSTSEAPGPLTSPAPTSSPPDPTTIPPAPSPTPTAATRPADERDLDVPGDGEHDRVFNWTFQGEAWSFHVAIPDDVYRAYRDRERPLRLVETDDGTVRMHAYDLYVSEPSDDAFVGGLAQAFADAAVERGWDNATRADLVLSFVQGLPYTRDNVTSPFDEYPRFPVETLVDEGGDCEDTAILLGALLEALGHEVALLAPPAHMALGIAMAVPGAPTYTVNGTAFVYAETTGEGWRIGEVPEAFHDASVQVFDTAPKPLLEADLGILGTDEGRQEFAIVAVNIGTAPARDVVLFAALRDEDGATYDRRSCRRDDVPIGADVTCEVWLDLRTVPRGVAVRVHVEVQDGTWLHDRLVTSAWTPRPA